MIVGVYGYGSVVLRQFCFELFGGNNFCSCWSICVWFVRLKTGVKKEEDECCCSW